MIRKLLFAAAIAFSAAAGMATTASADPSSPFGTLGCSCQPPVAAPDGKAPAMDPLDLGIQNGLAFLHGTQHPANN